MNNTSFSEHSLAGIPVQETAREIETPQVAIDSASSDVVDLFHQELEERDLGNIIEKASSPVRFGMEDGMEKSGMSIKLDVPEIEGAKDFSDALRVYDTMGDSPAKYALEEKMEGFRRSLMNRGFMDPVIKFSLEQEQEKLSRLDALAVDWKAHPEARKKAVEAYGEEWVKAFEKVPDERKDLVRGDKLLNEFYSRPGDKEGDARMRLFSSLSQDELNGIRTDADIWKLFDRERSGVRKEQERKKAALEQLSNDISPFLEDYVKGKSVYLSPEQVKMLGEVGIPWQSLRKAKRGYEAVAAYIGGDRLYDDQVISKLSVVIGDDEAARQMLLNILYNDSRKLARTKFNQVKFNGDESSSGFLESAVVRGKRAFEGGWRDLEHLGEAEAASNVAARMPDKIAAGLSMEEARKEIEQDRAFLKIKRRWEADLAQTMTEAEQDYLNSTERSVLQRVASKVGGIVGDTSTFLVPYGGLFKAASLGRMAGVARLGGAATKFGIAGGSLRQSRREEGSMVGLDMLENEQRAGLFGTADFMEEMIAFGALGRMVPGFRRLTKWAGRGRPASWRARFASSPKVQLAAHTLMGVAEEGFLEPTAGYIMRSAAGIFLNDERGKETFSNYVSNLEQMMDPEQFAALALFSGSMSSLNYGQLRRDSAQFRDMLAAYKASGGTEAGLLDAMKQSDRKSVLQRATENLHRELLENPQESRKRAKEAGREMLSGERIESLRELDAWRATEAVGMVPRVEPAEQEGMFRVYAPARGTVKWDKDGNPVQTTEKGNLEAVIGGKKQREDSTAATGQQAENGQPSYTLMDGEQMTAYLQAFVDADMENTIVRTQNMLAGDVTVNQALAQRRFDAAELITRTETDEKTGAEQVVIAPETLGQMKARADMAMAAIRALEAEGVSYQEAAARIDASLSEHIPLGTLVQTWDEAQERIRTEQARNPEFKAPDMDAPFSRAYVTKVRRGDTFRRILRYARGSATVEDLMEETMEQAVISWQAEQNTTWEEFGTMLQAAQKSINDLFPEARGKEMQFIHLDAGKPVTGHDAIEAFSKIGRSRWLADALNNTSLPSWLRKLLNHLVKFLGYFKARVELGEMVRQAEEQGVFTLPVRQALAVMLDAGNALYRDQQGDLIALTMDRAKAQAELDAALGRGVATEQDAVEEQLAERNAADEPGPVDRAEEEADDANAQQARRERTEAEVEMLGESDDDGVFNGGVSIRIEDGVRQGFIDKDRLTLCPDVPQFKQGANERGVVNRIVGAWQRNASPISVWRRTDGSLQVISGRHRLDACTDADINCTVYEEGDRFNLDWARRHDVENNIRDGQASAFEIARYVRDSSLSMAEAVERGIARKGASLKGVELGLYASRELLDALGNGLVSADDAYRVALAFRNDAEVQRSGLAVLLDGGSFNEAYSVMTVRANMERIRAVAEAGGMTFETDLFGNSNADAYLRKLAEYATRKQRELSSELSAISGAARKPEVARRYGVNVKDKAALDALIKEMREKARRWKNFGIHEDLLREANDAVMVEMGLKSREDVDRENGVLPLEEPAQDQEEDSAAQGTLMLSRDVSRMLEVVLKGNTTNLKEEGPVTNFSIVSIPSEDVVRTVSEMREQLKPLQGHVFTNKNTGIQAVIEARVSAKTKGKAGASQMSVANLKRFGISVEEARTIHYTAATRIHELFENAEDALFEKSYKDDPSRSGAYHLFNTVEVEGFGKFDVNVTAIAPENKERINTLYTIELTIENPSSTNEEVPLSHGGVSSDTSGVSTRNLSSYRSFVEKEKASIKKKALADGTFMKAPNGADTNLTEDQWLSVRTEAFKRWFGDWEHDPENASKVVDENGEPRVVYHGTPNEFTVFRNTQQNDAGWLGKGYYFYGVEEESHGYMGKKDGHLMALFLNIRDPYYLSEEEHDELVERDDVDFSAEFTERIREDGYDGVYYNGDLRQEWMALDSTQIKSATDNRGTYDPKNPDTTFSVIGPHAKTWERYADKAFAGRDDGKMRAEIDASQAQMKTAPGMPYLSKLDLLADELRYLKNPERKGILSDYLDYPELYEAYPRLKKMPVYVFKDRNQQEAGWYDGQDGSITINLTRLGPLWNQHSTLLHEIQHAIQEYEGFAKGGTAGFAESVLAHQRNSITGDIIAKTRRKSWLLARDAALDALGRVRRLIRNPKAIKKMSERFVVREVTDVNVMAKQAIELLLKEYNELVAQDTEYGKFTIREDADGCELPHCYAGEMKDGGVNVDAITIEQIERQIQAVKDTPSRKMRFPGEEKRIWQELEKLYRGKDAIVRKLKELAPFDLYQRLAGEIEAMNVESRKDMTAQEREVTPFNDTLEYPGEAIVTFSIIGEKAESFLDYHNNGLSYTDPADGKRKAIIDSRGVRLKKERMGLSEGGHVNVSLAAALDFPELFRAYPELRKLRVDFYRDSKSTTGGFTDQRENYIAVNVARGGKLAEPGLMLDTILHEVQHVIQLHEGFAMGASNMDQESALAYLDASIAGLHGRDDAWARAARPRLKSMRADVASGVLDPAMIYFFSHGEQEARLAGRFSKNGTGVVMSGLNGFRLLDKPAFTVPLTGNITELGGITFGAGRFGRMADRILSPNGDWLYDEMVFKMRAATQRAVTKLDLYHAGDREAGLEMIAECQELISTVERYLPHTYGFGLEPYKIWLNVFSLLYGGGRRGDAAQDIVRNALEAIPMSKWPEIMEGSFIKNFVKWAENRPELEEVIEEARREIAERQSDYELDSSPGADNKAARAARKGVEQEVWHKLFLEYGTEFLEEYGEQKVYRLIGKFMSRVVEQIDRYRKDRTLGRIRRVVASVAPRTNPKGKPMLGKMDAETYRKLEKYMRLLEMTESQYDEFFQKNFPEDAEEGKRWEDLSPDALVQVTLPDAEGRLEEVTVTQREFETYACYERMDVNTAEKCGAALGEFISTSRHAWENAVEKKKLEIAAMAAPVLQATGELDDNRMAKFRRKARLRALPKKPLSLFDYLMNFNQYMQALSSVEPFADIARQFDERASRFNVQRQASEKDMLRFVHNTVAEMVGSADRYDIAEWIYEGRMKEDTGISVVEREPDWNKKANTLYRERLLHLLRRKVKSHGLEAVQLYLGEFKLSEGLKKEVNALFGHRRKEISAKQAEKAREHMERVFTQKEWERYGNQEIFVRERAEMLRSRTKYAREGYQPKSYRLDGLSRMEAAYLVLLSEQADYTEALAERGFDAALMDQLREFAGDEVMRFAYALREKLNERSGQVQEMTEKRYGTPFPLAENYFRAFFDVTMEAIDKSIADAASYGEAATGGKYGMIHARRKHHAHLDLEMDVCTAFMAAMTEQDLYLYGSEISRDLRALLNFKGEAGEAGRSLEVLLGRDAVGKLMAWADAFDRAGAESIRGHLDMNRLMNRLSGAAARVLLSGRVGTLTKQVTTVINAMYASDEITLAEWLGAVRRYHAGKLVKSVREMETLPELDSRDKSQFSATLTAMGADEAGRRVSRLERWNREGMDLLERVDMKGNTISAAILYDAVYRKAKRETPDATQDELDAVAMAEVRRSLSRKGQPMTQLQKSLAAQHRTWMQAGMLFLGGESINTIGNVFSLARSGQWGKAGLMWVSHGMVLAILNGLLNFATDDEKRRRKREWWHALFDVVMGPVMGIPVVSGLAGEGVRQLAKLCGYNAFMPGNNLLVPFSNAADIGKAFSNAWKVFDGKERPWEDDALSFHELLRTAAVGTAAFSPRTTKGGAAAVGAALTMAALLNVTEFALKTVRSVQENGADWDKWTGR